MDQLPDDKNSEARPETSEADSPIALDEYLHFMDGDLRPAFVGSSRTLLINVDGILVPTRVARTIGLIVHDIIFDGLRKAFGEQPGIVQIACGADRDGAITLEITDDGIGTTTHLAPALRNLVAEHVSQLGARMTVENSHSVLRCSIVIPAHDSV